MYQKLFVITCLVLTTEWTYCAQDQSEFVLHLADLLNVEVSDPLQFPVWTISKGELTISEFEGNFNLSDKALYPSVDLEHVYSLEGQLWNATSSNGSVFMVYRETHTTDPITRVGFKILQTHPPDYNRLIFRHLSQPDEVIFGGGVQYTYLNLKGRVWPIWTREQGIGRNKSDYVTQVMDLSSDAGGDYNTTYFPLAQGLSNRNYACHVHANGSYTVLDFTQPNFTAIQIYKKTNLNGIALDYYFNDSMATLTKTLSNLNGRIEIEPPAWTYDGFTLGVQGGRERVMGIVQNLTSEGVRLNAIWIQDWVGRLNTDFGQRLYWNWQANETLYPDLRGMIQDLRKQNIRTLGYINPYLIEGGSLFVTAAAAGYLVRKEVGNSNGPKQPYLLDFGGFRGGMVDFTNPSALAWYANEVIGKNMIDLGFSGWMADFAEYLPVGPDVKLYAGVSEELHNQWPALWAEVNYRAVQKAGQLEEIFFWTRSGGDGSTRWTTGGWLGDQNVDWSYSDGLPTVVIGLVSGGLAGVGSLHHDIGLYTSVLNITRSPELLLRSAEIALFEPFFRSHEGNRPASNVQVYSNLDLIKQFARLTSIYVELAQNYTSHVMSGWVSTGMPVHRPLSMHYGADPVTWSGQTNYQFLLGRDLLVAPAITEGRNTTRLYLPADSWTHLWTNETYTGPKWLEVESPIGFPAAFYLTNSKFNQVFKSIGLL